MKKTATKAKKSLKSKVTRTAAPVKHKNLVHRYVAERDTFFIDHPNARVLLGIFVVCVALFIGIWFWGEVQIMNDEIRIQADAYMLQP